MREVNWQSGRESAKQQGFRLQVAADRGSLPTTLNLQPATSYMIWITSAGLAARISCTRSFTFCANS